MNYHIDTGLIKDKFKTDCECPLCEIEAVAEEQFLHEFLNDAVMEETTRLKVNKTGFCAHHFDMLFNRQNKLSVALQISTRTSNIISGIEEVKSVKQAKKQAEALLKEKDSCIICNLLEDSMKKYYKTVAQLFMREKDFYKSMISTKGFCLKHYAMLLKYSASAGFAKKDYLSLLSSLQVKNLKRVQGDLDDFCDKHDYRNALKPMGNAETALPRMRTKLYGKKVD